MYTSCGSTIACSRWCPECEGCASVTVVRHCGCCFGVESHVAVPILRDFHAFVDCLQAGGRFLPFGSGCHPSCKGTSAERVSGRDSRLPNAALLRRRLPRRQRPARCRNLQCQKCIVWPFMPCLLPAFLQATVSFVHPSDAC